MDTQTVLTPHQLDEHKQDIIDLEMRVKELQLNSMELNVKADQYKKSLVELGEAKLRDISEKRSNINDCYQILKSHISQAYSLKKYEDINKSLAPKKPILAKCSSMKDLNNQVKVNNSKISDSNLRYPARLFESKKQDSENQSNASSIKEDYEIAYSINKSKVENPSFKFIQCNQYDLDFFERVKLSTRSSHYFKSLTLLLDFIIQCRVIKILMQSIRVLNQ
jgi:hypothetical protein